MPTTIPTASSAQNLNDHLSNFRQQVRDGAKYVAKPINLNQVDEAARALDLKNSNASLWRVDGSTGNIKRGDGSFFQIKGLEVISKGPPRDLHFFQPIVEEAPPAGTVILVCDKQTGDVLVDIKVEPGSDPQREFTTFGPTLQVSSSRLKLAKTNNGDAALPLLSALVGLGALDVKAIEVQQDPGRFCNKRNENRVVFLDRKVDLDVANQPSLLWTNLAHLDDEINVNECNEFLWQTLGLLAREKRKAQI